jgi:hypothetical protein
VVALKELAEEDLQELTKRRRSARERAVRERVERLQEALSACDDVEEKRRQSRSRHKDKPPKGSSTDPEARLIQMADGGYRPAYNVQFATDVDSGVIVGVDVTNTGSDNGQMKPMADQIHTRYGQSPHNYLADGGFASLADIDHLETQHQCHVDTPIKDEEKKTRGGRRPLRPHTTRHGCDGPMASAHEKRHGQGHLQAPGPIGRMGECYLPKSPPVANAGSRKDALSGRRLAPCPDT